MMLIGKLKNDFLYALLDDGSVWLLFLEYRAEHVESLKFTRIKTLAHIRALKEANAHVFFIADHGRVYCHRESNLGQAIPVCYPHYSQRDNNDESYVCDEWMEDARHVKTQIIRPKTIERRRIQLRNPVLRYTTWDGNIGWIDEECDELRQIPLPAPLLMP